MRVVNIPVLIIGASFFGTGLASVLRDKCMVVQRDIMAGSEYICTYRVGTDWENCAEHECVRRFESELIKRRAVTKEFGPRIPDIQPVLYNYIKKEQLPVCFMTEVIEINRCEAGFETILSDVSGLYMVRSSYIIDTTMTGQCTGLSCQTKIKSINALIKSVNGADIASLMADKDFFTASQTGRWEITGGGGKNEAIFKLMLAVDDTIIDARKKLFNFWSNRPELFSVWRIEAVASQLEQHMEFKEKKIADNWLWYSPEQANPIEAMEQGIALGERISSELSDCLCTECRNDTEPVFTSSDIVEEYDVIVVGLGTAGAIAAITAAEKGLGVLGVESLNCMGGTATAGGILTYYYGGRGGRFELIDDKLSDPEASGYAKTHGRNPELKKLELEQQALAAGVRLAYDSVMVEVCKSGSRITGIRYKSGDKLITARAAYVIDATGEATVCRLAGCSFEYGRRGDHGCQPYSYCLLTMADGEVRSRSSDCGYIDQYNRDSVNKELLHSATLPLQLRDDYTSGEPILRMEQQLGVREGAYIYGEENVTFTDFLAGRECSKPVFYAYANLDNHRKDITFESDMQQAWTYGCGLWGLLMAVAIPLGAMIPRGYEGIMVVGRGMAVDHDMSSFTRMQRDCQKSGEAAATAIWLALRDSVSVRDISYEELAASLRETCCLDDRYKDKMEMMRPGGLHQGEKYLKPETDLELIRSMLDTDSAGLAAYSLLKLGKLVVPSLKQWLSMPISENFRRNTAIALALFSDRDSIPVLRDIIRSQDTAVVKTSAMFNQMRGVTAIYLEGRLGDEVIIQELIGIINNRRYCDNLNIEINEMIPSVEDAYFQFFSAAIMALMRIGRSKAELYGSIRRSIHEVLDSKAFTLVTTLKPTKTLKYDMRDIVREFVRAYGY